MAGVTVEQLNFELLINDEKFNAKIQEDVDAANKLNATLSQILEIKGKVASVSSSDVKNQRMANKILADNAKTQQKIATDAERAAQARRKVAETTTSQITRENALNREREAQAAIKTQIAQERLNQIQERGRQTLQRTTRLWQQMAAMAATYFSFAGAVKLVKTLTDVTAEFEMQRVTLGAILQDTQKAGEIFEQLKKLAVMSPFQFKDLATYAKQLSAFSIPVGELYDTTKMLADVSAGLGVGMDRLVLAYGQIRSASFLRGQEVRQLTEAGIPILEELRKQFVALGEEGITVGDVFDKISKRLVPFSMVEKVFKDMTSEGGKFYQMQEVQAETLKGKISNLTDAYQIMFSEIGEKHQGILKGSVDALRGIAENYQKIGRVLISLVYTYGMYKAVLIAVSVIQKTVSIENATNLKGFAAMTEAIKQLAAKTKILAAAQKLLQGINWPALAVGAITGVAVALTRAAKEARQFRKELEGIGIQHRQEGDKMIDDYRRLVNSLEGVTQGSQKYRDAIDEINRKYGEYLPKLLTEQTSLSELTRLEKELTNAIYARMRAYSQEEGVKRIQERYGTAADETLQTFLDKMSKAGVADKIAGQFAQEFRDRLTANPSDDVYVTFEEAFKKIFGKDKLDVAAVKWNGIRDAAYSYGVALRKVVQETNKFSRLLDVQNGSTAFGSLEEERLQSYTEKWYKDEQDKINGLNMSAEETEKALDDLYLKYVKIKKSNFEKDEKAKNQPGIWQQQIQQLDEIISSVSGGKLSTLQARVNGLLTGEGVQDLLPEASESQTGYFDKLRKEYDKTKDELADVDAVYQKFLNDKEKGLEIDEKAFATQEADVKRLQNRQHVIENIADDFGFQLEKARSGGTSAAAKIPEEIQDEVNSLKDLYTWVEKFKELGMSEDDAKGILGNLVPDQKDLLRGDALKQRLLDLADALSLFDDSGRQAAEGIRTLLETNPVQGKYDAIKKSLAAFEKYRSQIQDWMDKDYEIEDEGVSAKVSTILSRLATKNAQLATDANELKELYNEARGDEAALNLIRQLYGEETWEKYLERGESVIDELVAKENEADKKIAQNKINALAETYVKQQLFEKDLDLTDWGDKSYSQIKAITEQLKKMYVSPIEMSDEMRQKAKDLGIDLEKLGELVKEIFDNKWQNATVEEMKKFVAVAKGVSSGVSELGGAFTDMGESVDSGLLSNIGQAIEMAGEFADAILECTSLMEALATAESWDTMGDLLDSADILTMAVKMSMIFIKRVVNYVGEWYQTQMKLNEAAIAYRDTMHEISMMDAETIFGTDAMRQAAEGLRNLTRATSDLQDAQQKMKLGRSNNLAIFDLLASRRGLTGGWSAAYNEWNTMMDSTYEDSREYFEWLIANQEVIMSTMNKKQKAAFQNLLNSIESYKEAMSEVHNMMEDVFGGLADTMADSLINAFIETGDAATDLAENMSKTFSDLGVDIAKSLVSSFIISNILNKYKETAEALFTYMSDSSADPDVIAQKFGELADNITQDADAAAQFTNALLTALQTNGIDLSSEGGTKAMSNGIKSITEDTANLLASYINAIRADVSVTRTMIATILGLLPSAPTLSEYLAEIQANTYNTAVNTQFILEELRSTMAAYPNGGRAFNVNVS